MARTIGDNDWVLLMMSSGERRLVQVRASSKIHIGQSHVSAAPLLGTPFGANFRLETEGKKQDHKLVVDKRTVEQIDGDVTSALADMRGEAGPEMKNNAVLNDDGSAQSMDEHAIKKMKLEGAQGETIVRALAQNSASFAGKTAFSQEKWMKKKAKRHLHHLTAARPTALTLVDMYTLKGPEKVCSLRRDSLALLLSLSNVQPSSRALVLDSCLGLLAAAAAQRAGSGGAVLALHLQRPSLEAARWLNLEEGCLRALGSCSLLQLLRCPAAGTAATAEATAEGEATAAAMQAAAPAPAAEQPAAEAPHGSSEQADEGPSGEGSGAAASPAGAEAGVEAGVEAPKASEAKVHQGKAARKLSDSEVAAWVEPGFTSLLVACRESPLAALPQLLSRLQDGCPFVIYNPCVAPLADCMHYCQRHKLAVKLQLLEGFTRAYQVAPNRTHPTMNTYPPTGCVLSGVKVGAAQPQPHA
jgi:tRNA (adenine-N(1)-)-methyltransferase non-catalytic subunit